MVDATGTGRRHVLPRRRQGRGRLARLCLLPQGSRRPRNAAVVRADKKQRDLGEYMLNHPTTLRETTMNEDVFNASLRRFLKKVGITSQREIEKAVRDALAAGRLKGHEKLPAKMVLTIGGVSLTHEINDEIELG